MTVSAILKHKGYEVVSVDRAATVAAISDLLSRRHIGAVVVRNSGGELAL